MSDKEKLLSDSEVVRRKGNTEKWEELNNFFFNPNTQEFMGRDLEEWGEFLVFRMNPNKRVDASATAEQKTLQAQLDCRIAMIVALLHCTLRIQPCTRQHFFPFECVL